MVNIYFGLFGDIKITNENGNGNNPNDPDDIIIPENFTVKVPEQMIGDSAQYDYSIFAEMYSENKTSGEWSRNTLRATGQLLNEIPPVTEKIDGFNTKHNVITLHEETSATFIIKVEGSDSEPFTAHGALDINRNEYKDLNAKKIIQTETIAHVEVDPLPRIPKPIEYDGSMKSYPNPNEDQEDSLDEIIFMGNKKLKINDSSSILRRIESEYDWVSEWYSQIYNWTVEGAERVAGYNTLLINITTGFFQGFVDFNRKVWIANEVSFPVKIFVRTNTSYEDEEGEFYIILEHRQILQDNGFIRGNTEIPWGTCSAPIHFHQTHPRGEFKEFEFIPIAGSKYDQSSFKFKPEDAEQFALDNSVGLQQFLKKFDDVVCNWGSYRVYKDAKDELDTTGKAGKFNWNLSFGYKPTMNERREARESDEDPHWGYYVNLSFNVTKQPGIDKYSSFTKIINDGQYRYGDSPLTKSDVAERTLTLASSEEILKLDPDVKREICGPVGNEINFNDLYYSLVMGSVTTSTMPGMEIIETITGITLPTSRYSWSLQKGSVYLAGNTYSTAVDAETGQMLFILKIEGTDLYGMFS